MPRISWSMIGVAALGIGSATASAQEVGDQVMVRIETANLQRGQQALAVMPLGHRLRVLKIEGDWIGTSVRVNGDKVGGWVHRNDVSLVEPVTSAQPAEVAQPAPAPRAEFDEPKSQVLPVEASRPQLLPDPQPAPLPELVQQPKTSEVQVAVAVEELPPIAPQVAADEDNGEIPAATLAAFGLEGVEKLSDDEATRSDD